MYHQLYGIQLVFATHSYTIAGCNDNYVYIVKCITTGHGHKYTSFEAQLIKGEVLSTRISSINPSLTCCDLNTIPFNYTIPIYKLKLYIVVS